MGIQEVARRVLLGHWVVILICVVAGAGIAGALNVGQAPTYTASTRLVLDAPAPTSVTEATALSDTAKAIVTSPSHVIAALAAAGLQRDPVEVVKNITLVPLGTSGVLQLSAQDSNPAAAAKLANALADDLIQTRLAVSPVSQRAALDVRITAANDQITALDQQISALDDQLAALTVNPSDVQTATVQAQILADRITAYSTERSGLTQQELQLESERNSLGSSASVPTPSVIDRAVPPAHPDPSKLPVDLALALVIGVILGVAAAAAMETFGPTLTSGDAIAAAVGAPLLGYLPDPAGTMPDLLKLAARAAEVGAVELVAAGLVPNLSALAKSLSEPGEADETELNIFAAEDAPSRKGGPKSPIAAGLVLITPERIRKAALSPAKNLVQITGRPLLGVVVYTLHQPTNIGGPKTVVAPRLEVLGRDKRDSLGGMSQEVVSDLWGGR